MNFHPADGGDRRQGLPPETQSADFPQVLRFPELRGRVAEKGGGQFGGGNAAAVVAHPNQAHAAPAEFHRHGGGPGVHGVFYQLLYHAGGALHHLSGGDEVRYVRGKLLDLRHRATSFLRVFASGGSLGGNQSSHAAMTGIVTMEARVETKVI